MKQIASQMFAGYFSRTLAVQKHFVLFHRKPFKNDEKCFLFHLKSSFRSQDI